MSKFSRFLGSSKPIKLEFSRWLQIRMLGSKLYPTKRFTKIIKILNFFNFQNSIFNQTRRCSLWHYHIELGGFEIQDSPKNRTFRTIVNDLTTEPNYNLLEFSVFFSTFLRSRSTFDHDLTIKMIAGKQKIYWYINRKKWIFDQKMIEVAICDQLFNSFLFRNQWWPSGADQYQQEISKLGPSQGPWIPVQTRIRSFESKLSTYESWSLVFRVV